MAEANIYEDEGVMLRRSNPFFLFFFFLITVFLLSSGWSASAGAEVLKKATFLPQWFPQAQFAGYYVAQEKGLYRKHGLDLTILRGGPEAPPSRFLAQGKTDFTSMFLAEALQQRSSGFKLVNIGQIVQRSGFILVAKKSSGIRSPRDLAGKRVSLWPEFQVQPMAFFRKYNIEPRIFHQTYTLNLFLRGGVDAASAMWYNEYHSILAAGVDEEELTTFFLDRQGLNFPEDGLYCREETWRKDPDLVRRFVSASIEGWRHAFAHPEEALNIVMKYVNEAKINTSRVHQKWMLERMKDIIVPENKSLPVGTLLERDYETVARELSSAGLIRKIPPFGEFYVGSPGKD